MIKQLIDKFTDKDGSVRLDKVAIIYNIGTGSSLAKKVIGFSGSTDELLSQNPSESANVLKLVGKNGLLETLS